MLKRGQDGVYHHCRPSAVLGLDTHLGVCPSLSKEEMRPGGDSGRQTPGETGPDKGRRKGHGKGSGGKAMERVLLGGPNKLCGGLMRARGTRKQIAVLDTQSNGMPLGARKEVVRPAQGRW